MEKRETRSSIQVIERMMRLIEVLARHGQPVALKQVTRETGLHPSTAHRILSVMVENRLADRVEPGCYRLGIRLLELGHIVKSRINVREAALAHMQRLHAELRETVNLSVRQNDEMVYVERTSSNPSMMQVIQVIGARAPLHITAVGKIFSSKTARRRRGSTRSAPGFPLTPKTRFAICQASWKSWSRSRSAATPSTTKKRSGE